MDFCVWPNETSFGVQNSHYKVGHGFTEGACCKEHFEVALGVVGDVSATRFDAHIVNSMISYAQNLCVLNCGLRISHQSL